MCVVEVKCENNQTSADAYIGGTYKGVFTNDLCKHIRDTQVPITSSEVLNRVRASLYHHEGYDQTPQEEKEVLA